MLAELLRARAAETPDEAALIVDGDTLSFASWDRRSDAVAEGLRRRGVASGHRVVLCFDAADFVAFAVAAAGVHKAGAVMVPLPGHASVVEHDRVVRHSGAAAALGAADLPALEDGGGAGPPLAAPAPEPVELTYRVRPLAPARSSPHRSEQIVGDLDALDGDAPARSMLHASAVGTDVARWALWFPLRPGRGPVVTVPGADPERICALSAAHRVARWVLDPLVGALVLDAGAADGHDLSALTHLVLAGDPARPALLSRLAARFPGASILSVAPAAAEPTPPATVRRAPAGPRGDDVHRVVASAWERVLDRDGVGVDDDFFALGGDELAAVEVLSLLEDALGVAIAPAAFLAAPTVEGLVEQATTALAEAGDPSDREPGVAPVAASQEGMLWQEQLVPGSQSLPPLARRYRGPLDLDVLTRALTEIVRRHEPLRTTFNLRRGKPVQVVGPAGPVALDVRRLDARPAAEQADEVERFLAGARRPLDLVDGPVFEPTVLRLGPDDHVVVFRVHHSVYDDWSVGVFRRELSALYTAFAGGQRSPLPEPALSFSAFSRGQRRRLAGEAGTRELAWWRRTLAGAPLALQLPAHDPALPPGTPQAAAEPVSVTLPAPVHAQLRALARRERATVFTTALAAVSALVGRVTGQTELLLASVVANRNRVELEDLVGCFTKKVLLRVDLSGRPTFAELVVRARAALLGALSHQDLPFEAVLQQVLGPAAAASGLVPQAAVMFQGVTPAPGDVALPGLTTEGYDTARTTRRAHFAAAGEDGNGHGPDTGTPWGAGIYLGTFLILSVVEGDEGLSFVARGAFWPPAVERFLGDLATLLADAVAHPSHPVADLAGPGPGSAASGARIRGFPVDPRRVEDVLARHPAVGRVTVAVEESQPGDAHLVAHVVPVGDEPPTLDQLRVHLWRELPGYAWPGVLVLADRAAEVADARPAREAAPAEARLLARAWADELGVEDLPPDANYWQRFSFLEAVARVRDAGVRVGDAQVARNRTITALATDVAATARRGGGRRLPLPRNRCDV